MHRSGRGVYAAVLTPITPALDPDHTRFIDHCQYLLANGCDGLAPFGTTGEGASLGVQQKIDLIEAAESASLPMDRMIVGSGVCALSDAIELARVAASHQCEGLLCLPPFYYKNPDEDGLFEFYSELIEGVGDSRLRLFFYHFPNMSAVPITVTLIERLIARYPDIIAGLKDSSGDWSNTKRLIDTFPNFSVFSGSEQFLLENLKAGGAGCISATTNITSRQAQGVFSAWKNSDEGADQLQRALSARRIALQEFPMIPMLKAVKARETDDEAWLTMLPPTVALNEELVARLETIDAT